MTLAFVHSKSTCVVVFVYSVTELRFIIIILDHATTSSSNEWALASTSPLSSSAEGAHAHALLPRNSIEGAVDSLPRPSA